MQSALSNLNLTTETRPEIAKKNHSIEWLFPLSVFINHTLKERISPKHEMPLGRSHKVQVCILLLLGASASCTLLDH